MLNLGWLGNLGNLSNRVYVGGPKALEEMVEIFVRSFMLVPACASKAILNGSSFIGIK